MSRSNKKTLGAILAILAASAIWGTNYPINKIGLEYYSPLWFFVIKYSLAATLYSILFKRKGKKILRKHHAKIAVEAWVGISASIVLAYYALQQIRGIDAAIIYAFGPVTLYWLSVTLLRERFRLQPLLGTVIALAGALIITFDATRGQISHLPKIGIIFLCVSVILDALSTVFIKPYLKIYDVHRLALWRFFYALLPVVALAIITEPLPMFSLEPLAVLSILYSTLISVIIGWSLYYYGLKRMNGEDIGVLFYIEPIVGVMASFAVLGEVPNASFVLGASLVLAGIIAAEVHLKNRLFTHISRPRHH